MHQLLQHRLLAQLIHRIPAHRNEHALPFDPLIPNAKTIKAMKAARRGKLTPFTGIDELMLGLNAGD